MIADIQTGQPSGDLVRGLPIEALPTSANGWPPRPFQIVSLIDMIQFKPRMLCETLRVLRELEKQLINTTPADVDIHEDTSKFIQKILGEIQEGWIDGLGMGDDLSRHVTRFTDQLEGKVPWVEGARSNTTIRHEIRFLIEELKHSLGQRLFLCMPPDYAAYYERSAPFGEAIAQRFPEANKEAINACNCYAVESYTACVFHLTRVVEIAARVLVPALGVSDELKNHAGKKMPVKLCTWEQLLVALEKGVVRKQAGVSTSPAKRETFEFYSHAVSQFRSFKDAWRNKVSHKRKTYQAGSARDIMDNVERFMLHTSERLKEPKGAKFD